MSLLQVKSLAPQLVASVNTSKTLSANNTTVNVPIFRITGSVLVTKLYGVVTTVIGANHTGAGFRLNDQTAQVDITELAVGATLSALPAGTMIVKSALAATEASVLNASVGAVSEPGSAGINYNSECILTKKNGANTDIEYRYATTDAPTSGAIQFFCEYQALSASATITAL